MTQRNHLAATDVLHGQRVRLRLPRLDELAFIRVLWGDLETMAAVGGPIEFPEPKAKEWFHRVVEPGDTSNCYCLILDQEDVPVGEISFHRWDAKQRSAELNVKVLATRRGRGYARDALFAFLAFFFGRVGGRLMTDDVAIANHVGRQLLASLGFTRDAAEDVCRMVMTRQTYVSRHGEPDG